jgi:hypothetical protein
LPFIGFFCPASVVQPLSQIFAEQFNISIDADAFWPAWSATLQRLSGTSHSLIVIANSVFDGLPQFLPSPAPAPTAVLLVLDSRRAKYLPLSAFRVFQDLMPDPPSFPLRERTPLCLLEYAQADGHWCAAPCPERIFALLNELSGGHFSHFADVASAFQALARVKGLAFTGYIGEWVKVSRRLPHIAVMIESPAQSNPGLYAFGDALLWSLFLALPDGPDGSGTLPSDPRFADCVAHALHFMQGCCSSVVFLEGDDAFRAHGNASNTTVLLRDVQGVNLFGSGGMVTLVREVRPRPQTINHSVTFRSLAGFEEWLRSAALSFHQTDGTAKFNLDGYIAISSVALALVREQTEPKILEKAEASMIVKHVQVSKSGAV